MNIPTPNLHNQYTPVSMEAFNKLTSLGFTCVQSSSLSKSTLSDILRTGGVFLVNDKDKTFHQSCPSRLGHLVYSPFYIFNGLLAEEITTNAIKYFYTTNDKVVLNTPQIKTILKIVKDNLALINKSFSNVSNFNQFNIEKFITSLRLTKCDLLIGDIKKDKYYQSILSNVILFWEASFQNGLELFNHNNFQEYTLEVA